MSTRTFRFSVVAAPQSALESAARNLAPDGYAIFGAMPSTLSTGAASWQSQFHHYNGKAHYLAKNAGGGELQYYQFDESTSVWTRLFNSYSDNMLLLGQTGGHVYDGFGFDPSTESIWWQDFTKAPCYVSKWNGTGFAVDFDSEGSGNSSATPNPMEWHPNLRGGSVVSCTTRNAPGGSFYVKQWARSTRTMTTVSAPLVAGVDYSDSSAIYHPATDSVYLFVEAACFQVMNDGTVSRIGDAPGPVGYHSNTSDYKAVISPVSGDLLLLETRRSTAQTADKVYKLSGSAFVDTLTTHPFTTQLFSGAYFSQQAANVTAILSLCSLPSSYGAIFAIGGYGSTCRSALWKPTI